MFHNINWEKCTDISKCVIDMNKIPNCPPGVKANATLAAAAAAASVRRLFASFSFRRGEDSPCNSLPSARRSCAFPLSVWFGTGSGAPALAAEAAACSHGWLSPACCRRNSKRRRTSSSVRSTLLCSLPDPCTVSLAPPRHCDAALSCLMGAASFTGDASGWRQAGLPLLLRALGLGLSPPPSTLPAPPGWRVAEGCRA
jgi:hypothetical protein